jgi:parvulin-like peptidyl-prolyl isomerase
MRPFAAVGIIVALVASAAFCATPIMRVNNDSISDVDLKLAERALASQMPGTQPNEAVLLRQTLNQLISITLLLQAARDAKVTVDPKEVAASIDQQRQQAGGSDAFSKALAQAGLTEQDLTRMAENRLTIQKYVETDLKSKAGTTEQEVRAYYDQHPDEFKHEEQVKLRMIIVQIPQGADQAKKDEAKAKADAAHKRIVAGEDFGKVAQETSDHPNKAQGGELGGWVREAALPEFETALKGVKVGGVTEVLQNQYGFFIFKVEDRRAPGISSFDEVKANLTNFLENKKLDDSVRLVIETRRSKAKIEGLTPEVKAALEAPAAGEKPAAGAPAKAPAAQPATAATPAPDVPKKP